jgi:exodeoxyribonuclease V alpha subunit
VTPHLLPPEVAALEPYVDAGVLGVTEVQVVASFVRSVPDHEPGVDELLGLALAVRAPLHGHVRAELDDVADSLVPHAEPTASEIVVDAGPDEVADEGDADPFGLLAAPVGADGGGPADAPAEAVDVASLPWPAAGDWTHAMRRSPLVREEGEPEGERRAPVVAVGHALYLDRLHRDERRVASVLRERAAGRVEAVPPAARAAIDELFPVGPDGPDAQHRAATAALERDLVVIAGGPGTGKTRTIARLLAALHHQTTGVGPLEVALAAPTGKAAARLTDAVRREALAEDVDPSVRDRIVGAAAVTLHRLLGVRPSGTCRHDRHNLLTADVVVVDEMSMVDLPMAARLLDAVRPDARLVLVGDPSQLASVEAGAVLGDVVGTRGRPTPSALQGNVVVLDRVHRFGADSAIGALARAIDAGEPDVVLDLLRAPSGDGERVVLLDPDDDSAVEGLVDAVVDRGRRLVRTARLGDADAALRELGALQVLAATRRGPLGVADWNQRVDRALAADGLVRGQWAPGRPVMVTANDQLNKVFNGDVGVVVADTDREGRVKVAFDGVDGRRLVDPSRLDRYERLWAMTIHKSQGSEYDDVVVTLPPPPSPILTRELLYTAVTRARRAVTIVASDASIRAAVERPVQRSSGLAARLA